MFLLTGISLSLAVGLCICFNDGPLGEFSDYSSAAHGQGNPGSAPALQTAQEGSRLPIDSKWANRVYLMGNTGSGMSWLDAYDFCRSNGGYLAEPKTREEIVFLQNLARLSGKAHYWLGLKAFRNCNCRDRAREELNGGPVEPYFDAPFSEKELRESGNDPINTKACPGDSYSHSCADGNIWRFVTSGARKNASDWNWATGQPDGNWQENCVAMNGNGWSDWNCSRTSDGSVIFQPLCKPHKYFPKNSSRAQNSMINTFLVVLMGITTLLLLFFNIFL